MNLPIYLDYASTTPVDPVVAEKMMEFLTPAGQFGNPASRSHVFGWPFSSDKLAECNCMIHSDGGTRATRCSASAWILDVGVFDGEKWVAHHFAMGGTFYAEPISSFSAECLALMEAILFLRRAVQEVIRR